MRIEIVSKRRWFGGLRWYWRIKAGNNEIVATSGRETFASYQTCRDTVDAVVAAGKAGLPVIDVSQ